VACVCGRIVIPPGEIRASKPVSLRFPASKHPELALHRYNTDSMDRKPSSPRVRTAIQYDPRCRGLYLALAYVRIPKEDRSGHDLYGFVAGYSGGGCYEDEFFHVEQRHGVFTTYTSSYGTYWDIERIGDHGLVGTPLKREVESILDSVQTYLFRRWLKWTEEGLPELQDSAKRRLNCTRRRVFWMSSGFNYGLLEFMSSGSPISVCFGQRADEFRLSMRRRRAERRKKRQSETGHEPSA